MPTPTSFRAGDSVAWTESLANYKAADGWSLKYRLLNASGKIIDIDSTANGDDYDVSLTSIQTAAWTPGASSLVAFVEKGADRITLSVTEIVVLPNLVAASNYDGRSQNVRALEAAEAALVAYLEGGKGHVSEYEIDGRHMKFRNASEIKDLINHYRAAVNKERALLAMLDGGQPPGRCYYRG